MSHPHDCDDDCVCMSCQRRKSEKERDDALRAFLEKDDENTQLERELAEAKTSLAAAMTLHGDRSRLIDGLKSELAAEKEARERAEAACRSIDALYHETRAKLEAAEASAIAAWAEWSDAKVSNAYAIEHAERLKERAAHAETKRLATSISAVSTRRSREGRDS
jgi:hypothetical protein